MNCFTDVPKRELRCAFTAGSSDAPLGLVSLTKSVLMAAPAPRTPFFILVLPR